MLPGSLNFRTRSMGGASSLLPEDKDRQVEVFLNEKLDSIFGDTFSAVIAHEFKERYSSSLYETIRVGPTETRAALRSIFVSERAVSVILYALLESLRDASEKSESTVLLSLLEGLESEDRGTYA